MKETREEEGRSVKVDTTSKRLLAKSSRKRGKTK